MNTAAPRLYRERADELLKQNGLEGTRRQGLRSAMAQDLYGMRKKDVNHRTAKRASLLPRKELIV